MDQRLFLLVLDEPLLPCAPEGALLAERAVLPLNFAFACFALIRLHGVSDWRDFALNCDQLFDKLHIVIFQSL